MVNENAIYDRFAIQNMLSFEETLTQLAEESSELCQAALKCRRAIDKTNPTPVTSAEAYNNLLEEVKDVVNVLFVLGIIQPDYPMQHYIEPSKISRWRDRLSKMGV